MRIYNVIRHGARVTYKELTVKCTLPAHATTITIPGLIPTVLDPFLLWKETNDRIGLKNMTILDKNNNERFSINSSVPLEKMLELSKDITNEMK